MRTNRKLILATLVALHATCGVYCQEINLKEANIFPAGSFEQGSREFQIWPQNAKAELSISEETAFDGEKSLKITKTDMDSVAFYTYLKIEGGKDYTIDFAYKATTYTPLSRELALDIQFRKEGEGNGSAGKTTLSVDPPTVLDQWITVQKKFHAPKEAVEIQLVFKLSKLMFEGYLDNIIIALDENAQAELKTTYSISLPGESETLTIDGVLDEKVWKDSEKLSPFYFCFPSEALPQNSTTAYLTFDEKNLYLAFQCSIANPDDIIANAETRDDKDMWRDDGVEIFIFPKPANGYHFIVNANGVVSDYKVGMSEFATMSGFKEEIEWNAQVKAVVKKEAYCFTIEMAIPLSELSLDINNAEAILLNFCRTDNKSKEPSTFSQLTGRFLNPKCFSHLRKDNGTWSIKRFTSSDNKNPYTIERPVKLFTALQSTTPATISISSWCAYGGLRNNLRAIQGIDEQKIKSIQEETLKEFSKSGDMLGLFHDAWIKGLFKEDGGLDFVRQAYETYGIRTMLTAENSGVMAEAVDNGGEILSSAPVGAATKGTTSNIHPLYGKAALEGTTNLLTRMKNERWATIMYGQDEPLNGELERFSRSKNPHSPLIEKLDQQFKNEFGFGKYGIPDINDPKAYEDELDMRLRHIVFARGWTSEFIKYRVKINRGLKEINPNFKYVPLNMGMIPGIRFKDFSEFDVSMGDIISGDPYASWMVTPGRGKFNHGFGTKIMKDLVDMPEVLTIVQAFAYGGYKPNAEDIKEWVSQALKNGADHINYYDTDKYKQTEPAIYKEILRMNERISKMNKLKFPENAEVGILYSLYSHMSDGCESEANEAYTTYSVLGEGLMSWFKFVSDRDVEKEKTDLKDYKVIFVPYFEFGTEKIYTALIDALDAGATVVFLDPKSFEYDTEGKSFANIRETILGVSLQQECSQTTVTIPDLKGYFPVFKRHNNMWQNTASDIANAHYIDVLNDNVKVIATYADGKPAAVRGKHGKGTYYYFAFNPMVSDILVADNNWQDFMATILEENDIPMDNKIWQFHVDGK